MVTDVCPPSDAPSELGLLVSSTGTAGGLHRGVADLSSILHAILYQTQHRRSSQELGYSSVA